MFVPRTLERTIGALALAALLTAAGPKDPASAGRSCRAHDITVAELESAIAVAGKAREALNREATGFALIARVGDDVSGYGLTYTHMGLARRRADGEWVVVHELNPCASGGSILRVHGLATFMLDDLHSHDVLIVLLEPSLSASLERVFQGNGARQVYDPEYSMISYPGTPPRYQNSNQWILEVVAQAQAYRNGDHLVDRWQTHGFYRKHGYRGSMIRVPALKKALAGAFAANVRFDDHPRSSRARGTYEVVTVRSVVDYLRQTGDVRRAITVGGDYRRPSEGAGADAGDDLSRQ